MSNFSVLHAQIPVLSIACHRMLTALTIPSLWLICHGRQDACVFPKQATPRHASWLTQSQQQQNELKELHSCQHIRGGNGRFGLLQNLRMVHACTKSTRRSANCERRAKSPKPTLNKPIPQKPSLEPRPNNPQEAKLHDHREVFAHSRRVSGVVHGLAFKGSLFGLGFRA